MSVESIKKSLDQFINNWEATFFDFNADKIYEIAEVGYELGMELFVLDDGWFKEEILIRHHLATGLSMNRNYLRSR